MGPRIEISSILVNKLKSGIPFEKYNIDVSIDEIENNDLGIKLKYKFILLSTPTNAKISLEGLISILGNENEVSKYLEPDERNVPIIVNVAYQEILPLLYVLTKSIDIPCPAYKISQISQTKSPQTTKPIQEEPQVSAKAEPAKEEIIEVLKEEEEEKVVVQAKQAPSEPPLSKESPDVLDELEKLVEEQNVSSI